MSPRPREHDTRVSAGDRTPPMLAFTRGVKRLCAPPARTIEKTAWTALDGGVHRSVNLEPLSPNEHRYH